MPPGSPFPSGPVASVAEAIARMEAINAATPASDGLACFNRMYLAVTEALRAAFETNPELAVDRHLQAVDNLVASWIINSARDLAWQNALVLWALRPDPAGSGLFLDGLAATTALASRLLLTAV